MFRCKTGSIKKWGEGEREMSDVDDELTVQSFGRTSDWNVQTSQLLCYGSCSFVQIEKIIIIIIIIINTIGKMAHWEECGPNGHAGLLIVFL